MKTCMLLMGLSLSFTASAQCFSPGCGTPLPNGPAELCIREACQPVRYSWLGTMAVAESTLPNGYNVLGWAGPCAEASLNCPDILNQAFADLRTNALRANRAQEAD